MFSLDARCEQPAQGEGDDRKRKAEKPREKRRSVVNGRDKSRATTNERGNRDK